MEWTDYNGNTFSGDNIPIVFPDIENFTDYKISVPSKIKTTAVLIDDKIQNTIEDTTEIIKSVSGQTMAILALFAVGYLLSKVK